MTRKKIFLIVQAVLCALVAGLLAAAALRLYITGAAKQAEGDLFYSIYTREKAGEALLPVLPVLFIALGMTVAGVLLGIRDDRADTPGRDDRWLRSLGSIQMKAVRQAMPQSMLYLRTAVFALTVALIVLGILNGGLEDVLAKGAAVCTECVGLG